MTVGVLVLGAGAEMTSDVVVADWPESLPITSVDEGFSETKTPCVLVASDRVFGVEVVAKDGNPENTREKAKNEDVSRIQNAFAFLNTNGPRIMGGPFLL
jgi:hypothetical protein